VHVKRLGTKIEMRSFCAERKRPFDKRIDVVHGSSATCIAADDDTIDDGSVSGCAGIAAIGDSRGEVVGQTSRHRSDASNANLQRCCVEAAQDETIALI